MSGFISRLSANLLTVARGDAPDIVLLVAGRSVSRTTVGPSRSVTQASKGGSGGGVEDELVVAFHESARGRQAVVLCCVRPSRIRGWRRAFPEVGRRFPRAGIRRAVSASLK